jgi:spore coat polysaccharide biosynthesis protein SpsF
MLKRKIGIILQARMGSKRLPGKVMRQLAGKPMIQWIIERLKLCKQPDILILATSNLAEEQPLVDCAKQLDIEVFRGSELDVLARYYDCALQYGLDDVIRATGDNPFVDPEECDRLVDFYQAQSLDYATISTHISDGYPLGVGLEIFSIDALKKSFIEGKMSHHREHVNEYILENPDLFQQAQMIAPPSKCAGNISLTVDTLDQFIGAETIYSEYLKIDKSGLVPVEWVISWLRKNGN